MPAAKQTPGLTHGRGVLANMTALNLSRLFELLVHPDRRLTDVDRAMAEATMFEIAPGVKTENNPNYQHKAEGKPGVQKSHDHSGTRNKPTPPRKKATQKDLDNLLFNPGLRPQFSNR